MYYICICLSMCAYVYTHTHTYTYMYNSINHTCSSHVLFDISWNYFTESILGPIKSNFNDMILFIFKNVFICLLYVQWGFVCMFVCAQYMCLVDKSQTCLGIGFTGDSKLSCWPQKFKQPVFLTPKLSLQTSCHSFMYVYVSLKFNEVICR